MNTSIRRPRRTGRVVTATALTLAVATALTACGAQDENDNADASAARVSDPVVATFDGGLYILDGESLKRTGTIRLAGYNRVNPAGDADHVVVSTDSGFRVLDAAGQKLTDIEYKGAKPGHVVRHAGKTALFTDGTGEVNVFDPADLAHAADRSGGKKPEGRTYTSAEAHHGVAIELENGELLTTVGTEEKRTGALVLDKNDKVVARNESCPGVHGEAAAKDEAIAVGCEDGVLLYKDGEFTKIDAPDAYGRIGNQAGSDVSPVLLGDYKTDPEAELERPTRVSLIDTEKKTLRLVDLGTSYTFRSLARGPHGEALVLGTDGAIHVIDPVSGKKVKKIPAVSAWQEPLDWQRTRPNLFVRDRTAYVSEPAAKKVHAFDLDSGRKLASVTLPKSSNELSGVAPH